MKNRFRMASFAMLAFAAGCVSGAAAGKAYWKSAIFEINGMPVEKWRELAAGFPLLSIVLIYLTGGLIVYAAIECWYLIRWLRNRPEADPAAPACPDAINRFALVAALVLVFGSGRRQGIMESKAYWEPVAIETWLAGGPGTRDKTLEEWGGKLDGQPSGALFFLSYSPLIFVCFCYFSYSFVRRWRSRLKAAPGLAC